MLKFFILTNLIKLFFNFINEIIYCYHSLEMYTFHIFFSSINIMLNNLIILQT